MGGKCDNNERDLNILHFFPKVLGYKKKSYITKDDITESDSMEIRCILNISKQDLKNFALSSIHIDVNILYFQVSM